MQWLLLGALPGGASTTSEAGLSKQQLCKCAALLQVIHRFYQRYTGLELEKIEEETDRDNFMSPEQAQDLGIIDGVILSSDISAPTATATAVAA